MIQLYVSLYSTMLYNAIPLENYASVDLDNSVGIIIPLQLLMMQLVPLSMLLVNLQLLMML